MLTVYEQGTNIYFELENSFADLINFETHRQYSPFRGVPRTPGTSMMEFFVKLVNFRKLLTNATKSFILDVVKVLNTYLPCNVLLTNRLSYFIKK